MNSNYKRSVSCRISICVALLIIFFSSNAQRTSLTRNAHTPITTSTFANLAVTSSTFELLEPSDDFVDKANIINTDHNDVAKWDYLNLPRVQTAFVDVMDNNATGAAAYPAGSYAGFVIDASNLGLFSSTTITVTTLLNNEVQEKCATGVDGLVSLSGCNISRAGFTTTKHFNRLRIAFDVLGVSEAGTILVYYPEVNKYQAGLNLPCNTFTPISLPQYPASVQTFFGGLLEMGSIHNANSVISASASDFATIDLTTGLLGDSAAIAVKDNITNYPAGTFAGFEIDNSALLNIGVVNCFILTAYLDGVQQGQPVTGDDLLAGAELSSTNSRQRIGFVTTGSVDEIKLTIKPGLLAANLGITRVYRALFKKMCEGPAPTCNLLTNIDQNNYPIYINAQRTGASGLLSANNSITDAQNLIDGNRTSAATTKVLAGAGNSASLAIKKELSSFAEGTFSGFEVSSSSLSAPNLLNNITISTYEDNVLRETFNNSNNSLLSINSGILTGGTRQIVGFIAGLSYDEVAISFNNALAVDLGTVSVHEFYHKIFCPGSIECNKTIWLNTAPPPAGYPTVINTKRTGLSGVACADCAVSLPDHVLSPLASDFATINIGAGTLSKGSIAVKDILSTYPSNSVAGFIIKNTSSPVATDVLNTITITTYKNDALCETFNGSNLLNLEVAGQPLIEAGNGVYYVGFKTTKIFDEIVINISSMASVLNTTQVFGAFVDTRFVTNGDGSQLLSCLTSYVTPAIVPPLCKGDSIVLISSVLSGNQWYKDGVKIVGGTGITCVVRAPGSYYVTNSDSKYNGAPSNIVDVAFHSKPIATTLSIAGGGLPVLCNAGSITLKSSTSTGLKWFKDGVAINGLSGGLLNATETGAYTALIDDGGCVSDTSNKIEVTVGALPPAAIQVFESAAPIICNGADIVLSSNAEYGNQWFKDGVLIPGATSQFYTAAVEGGYAVVLTSGSCVSIPSNQIIVSVSNVKSANISLEGSRAPELCADDAITLTSSVALGNQWLKDGVLLLDASLQNLTVTQPGSYCVIVTAGGCSSHPSDIAIINTRTIAPPIVAVESGRQPTICTGGSIKLASDNATGNQWFKNGEIIAGATDQVYIATAPGAYTSTTIDGNCISPFSNLITVTVKDLVAPVASIKNNASSILCPGDSLKLVSTTLGANQWFKNDVEITGAIAGELGIFDTGSYSIKYSIDNCESPSSNIIKISSGSVASSVISVLENAIPNICNGEAVVLISSSTLGNQWYKGGVKIRGAINQSYTVAETGIYTVVNVNGPCPSGVSNKIEVTKNTISAPVLTVEGDRAMFCEGSNVTLKSSSISGNIWYKNGLMILGISGQTYTTSDAGVYTVKLAKGLCSSDRSNEITAIKTPIPPVSSIAALKGKHSFCSGDSATMIATTSVGNQWYKNGEIITEATGTVFTAKEKGKYTLIVTVEGCSSRHSNFVNINVFDKPATAVVSLVGKNNMICPGQNATLKSSIPADNRWYRDGVLIAGARDSVYVAKDQGIYTVQIESAYGCIGGLSNIVTIEQPNVLVSAQISIVGNNISLCDSQSVTLTSTAVNGNRWYLNGTLIENVTEQTLKTNKVGVYTAIVTNGTCSSMVSNKIALKTSAKSEAPAITTTDNKTSICIGSSVWLRSGGSGNVQWFKNGNVIPSTSASQLLISEPGAYSAQIIGNCPSDISNVIEIKELVIRTPSIKVISGNLNRCPGFGALLQSSANANNRWLRNGVPIGEAASQQYLSVDSAVYSVIVAQDGCVSDTSNSIKLTLSQAPEPLLITNIEIEPPSNCETDDGVMRIKGNRSNTLYYVEMIRNGKTVFREAGSNADGVIEMRIGNGNYDGINIMFGETGCASGPLNHLFSVREACIDTDSDGLQNNVDLDDDNDGINDVLENAQCAIHSDTCDTDGDKIPNRIDLDSDNDGINDVREANGLDGLGDGVADGTVSLETQTYGIPLSAGNGLIPTDFDNDARPNPYDLDADDDGLNDVVENMGALDENRDAIVEGDDIDGDGILSNADKLPKVWRDQDDSPLADTDEDGLPNYIDLNSDNDQWPDLFEIGKDKMLQYDSNSDGMIDDKSDSDRDGIISVLDGAPDVFGDFETPRVPNIETNSNPDPYKDSSAISSSDLSMSLIVLPGVIHGVQNAALVGTVYQLAMLPSMGTIKVFLSRESRVSYTFNAKATELYDQKVNNSNWSIDETSSVGFVILTSDAVIKPKESISFGLDMLVNPSNAQGTLAITASILLGSGEDNNVQNNTDADVLKYFIN